MNDIKKILDELQFLSTTVLKNLKENNDDISKLLAELDLAKNDFEEILNHLKKQKTEDFKKMNTLLSELKNSNTTLKSKTTTNINNSQINNCNKIYITLLVAILLTSIINLFL